MWIKDKIVKYFIIHSCNLRHSHMTNEINMIRVLDGKDKWTIGPELNGFSSAFKFWNWRL